MFKISLTLYSFLSLFTPALAARPRTGAIAQHEVVPGPGLPSLKSLGFTSEDLYKMAPDIPTHPSRDLVSRQAASGCISIGNGGVPIGNAQACLNYLWSIGNVQCGITGGLTDENIFCVSGPAIIYGFNVGPYPVAASACRDVVNGLAWVMNNCESNGEVAGFAPAYGNGFMQLGIGQYAD